MGYLTSCSISENKSDWKNSVIVIPKPSQSFWIVATVVLLLRPLTILFTVDCVTPLLMERALIEISRSWQSPIILCRTASPILERLTKPKSNQSSSKGEEGQMDISPTFISNKQTPISMEPGKGALDNPTVFSKMSGTLHPSSGNSVLYVPYRARLSAKWVIISFISVEFLRVTSRFPMQIPQGWQMIKHIF